MYDQNTLRETIVHQAVGHAQLTMLPGSLQQIGEQMKNLQDQLGAAQQQLKQCAEAIDAKNAHIDARNAQITLLNSKVEALVAKFGPAASDVLASVEAAALAPAVESEGGEAA